jgi:ribosome-binding protein 1
MVKLRKQLAEKEKALTDEQEAALAVQNKLKELRVEFNAERSRWRHVEETAAAKQQELVNANNR